MNSLHGNRLTVGTPGARTLVDYGIQTELSDIRAHVCVLAGLVYVFRTADALATLRQGIDAGRYVMKTATQPGATSVTAEGYPVPVADLRTVPVNAKRLIAGQNFQPNDSTTVKGSKAVAVVATLLRCGWFPMLMVRPDEAQDMEMQVNGIDLLVQGRWHIQVKCDYRGGARPLGTGNLFLQTAESNPFRRT